LDIVITCTCVCVCFCERTEPARSTKKKFGKTSLLEDTQIKKMSSDTSATTTATTTTAPTATGNEPEKEKEKEKEIPADKVVVLFKAVGNAPALKLKKFQVSREATVQTVIDFLRKQLKYTATDPLVRPPPLSPVARPLALICALQFVFVNCAFQPPPDRQLGQLAKCFATSGKIVFHYATTQAWG